jgi:hypothetical protein
VAETLLETGPTRTREVPIDVLDVNIKGIELQHREMVAIQRYASGRLTPFTSS